MYQKAVKRIRKRIDKFKKYTLLGPIFAERKFHGWTCDISVFRQNLFSQMSAFQIFVRDIISREDAEIAASERRTICTNLCTIAVPCVTTLKRESNLF